MFSISKKEINQIFRTRLNEFISFRRRFTRNRTSVFGFWTLFGIFVLAWGVPFTIQVNSLKMVADSFIPPSFDYIMGTDDLGRNVLHQIIIGAQTSIMVGITAAIVSTLIGLLVGAMSGYYGGKTDSILMRITEFFMVVPKFFLALILVAILGASIWNIILAIGVLAWPRTARLVRGEFLRFKNLEFVMAAKALGASNLRIIFQEILPNAIPPVIVNTALEVGSAITVEAGISFLGLGDPQQMSWGVILFQSQMFIRRAPWMSIFAGAGIFLTVLSLNLLADGLNEALNPKFRRI